MFWIVSCALHDYPQETGEMWFPPQSLVNHLRVGVNPGLKLGVGIRSGHSMGGESAPTTCLCGACQRESLTLPSSCPSHPGKVEAMW